MPALRGVYLTHPQTEEVGLWLELSTSPVGTLTGMARTAWPSTAGKTLANYQAELNIVYRDLCSLPGLPSTLIFGVQPPEGYYVSGTQLIPMIVWVVITLSSLTPVTISNVEVKEGAARQVKV
jgi:hypothetical protein